MYLKLCTLKLSSKALVVLKVLTYGEHFFSQYNCIFKSEVLL